MPTLIINGQEITVEPGTTIMEAARQLEIHIPHFCYHPGLSVAGNCRMCMVEVEKMPRPVISCAMPVSEGMVVRTESPMALQARKGVMEFLLINHPLDCPVCDQGGECDLQDLALKYGPDRSRYTVGKREVRNKDLGPLIETEMDRCIHCTRCIRFSAEVAGTEEMGAMYRGDHMAVGPWVEGALGSEMAGNMAEICPVGALNDKPFHFQARSWELRSVPGVCGHCAVGCRVFWQQVHGRVKRVQADACEAINGAWICDKGRFAFDGLEMARLTVPLVRKEEVLTATTWKQALAQAGEIVRSVAPDEVAGLAGGYHLSAEDLFAFQDLLRHSVGTPHLDHRLQQRDFSGDELPLTRSDFLLNTPLADLPRADCIVLVGCDPRREAPILNWRLRQAALAGAKMFAVNPRRLRTTWPGLTEIVQPPGREGEFLDQVLKAQKAKKPGNTPAALVAAALKDAGRPVLLLGALAISHPQAEVLRRQAVAILDGCGGLGREWNGFNRLASPGSSQAAQDMGVVPHRGPGYQPSERVGHNALEIVRQAAAGKIKVLVLLATDPVQDGLDAELARAALTRAQVIWIGSHRSAMMERAAVVLPGAVAVPEQDAISTNGEGRVQWSEQVVPPPGDARPAWRICRALSDHLARPLGYDTLEALRTAVALADPAYDLKRPPVEGAVAGDHPTVTRGLTGKTKVVPAVAGTELTLVLEPSFWYADAVARVSATMDKLSVRRQVRLHPADARRLGVTEGQKVRLTSGERCVDLTATLDDAIPAGTLFGHYGQGEEEAQSVCEWDTGFPAVDVAVLA
ncbi:MAG: NADH-quinone oxidoreductase subunit NuoG [Magnetococcales bacterium]|nr:NADH-quinone oxidoreductase subunit NuoG [Magnetococcales bacterium]